MTIQPSKADVAKWRKLISAAAHLAKQPRSFGGDLLKAANAAGKTTIPPGYSYRGSPFVQLVRLSRDLACAMPDQRRAHADQLLALVELCKAALDDGGLPPTPPAAGALPIPDLHPVEDPDQLPLWARRKDIGG